MKMAKFMLIGALTLGPVIPPLVTMQSAEAAVVSKYTTADRNYMNYNGHYFTTVEAAGYSAKSWYFHNDRKNGTPIAAFGNYFESAMQETYDKMVYDYRARMKAWNEITGNAYRPVDVPAKFATSYKYFKLAVASQNAGKVAYGQYIDLMAKAVDNGIDANGKWVGNAPLKAQADAAYNRLVQSERNYVYYKGFYLQEINRLNHYYK